MPARRSLCVLADRSAEPALDELAALDSLEGLKGEISREWGPASRRCGALAMKCGMTQEWNPHGVHLPLTVVELEDVQVLQRKTLDENGFFSLKLGSGWQKSKRLNRARQGEFTAAAVPPKRFMREFRVTEDALLPVGTSINVRHFVAGQYVDVQGVTRGKGFQGVMKRWGFAGQPSSHGASKSHRSRGSSGGAAGSLYATRVRKGMKMAGRMGNKTRTVFNMMVYKIDTEHNLLYLKGSIPGTHGGLLRIKDPVKPSARIKRKNLRGPFPTWLPGDEGDGVDEILIAAATEYDPILEQRKVF